MSSGNGFKRYCPRSPGRDGRLRTIAGSSMASSGCSARELAGETSPSAMAPGARWPAASTAGERPVSGIASLRACSSKRMLPARWIGRYITSTAPSCGRGKRGDPEKQALGRSRGGFSTKVHLRAEGNGKLLTLILTPGQRHEATIFEGLMEQGALKRGGRGRPKRRPQRIVGDKGYSSQRIRRYARRHGVRITIPRKENECRRGPFNRALYRQRNRVERLVNRCKQFRRLATRYEKRAENYRALWVIAATLLWL